MLAYKAALASIQVNLTEESYTSSFLDADSLPVYNSPEAETANFSAE